MAIMHDAKPSESPGRYGPHYIVMKEMGWSWQQLRESPADLIEEVLLHINYQRHWERKRAEVDQMKAKAQRG